MNRLEKFKPCDGLELCPDQEKHPEAWEFVYSAKYVDELIEQKNRIIESLKDKISDYESTMDAFGIVYDPDKQKDCM